MGSDKGTADAAPTSLRGTATWLLEQSQVHHDPGSIIAALSHHLECAGVPLLRMSAWLPTQHPELWGSQVLWKRGQPVEVLKRSWDIYDTPVFQGTPGQAMHDGSEPIHARLDIPRDQLRFPMLAEIATDGGTDYFIMPVPMGGRFRFAWISFATDRKDGFRDTELAELEALTQPLSLHFQLISERSAKRSLLDVYLGHNASQHVLDGSFRRGTGTMIRAAIWFCDLRGYTELSDQFSAEQLLTMLDRYFECVAEPIEANDGEVLKLIGDAALAIFPIDESGPTAPCRRALTAAEQAIRGLAELCDEHPEWPPLAMGVALHVGDVFYGNIGGKSRLDFTVIGRAVNEVCRVESLCKTLGTPLLMTAIFAEAARAEATVSLGHHSLRGVEAPQELRALRRLMSASSDRE